MNFSLKKTIAAVIFAVIAVLIANITPSVEISWVVAILLLTIYLFAFEIVEVDVAAITIMVILGLTSLEFFQELLGIKSALISQHNLFDGFASNAVISIIAVMIIGAGLDKTGLMTKVAKTILVIGGKSERRIIPTISATVGTISSFMQNVGAAALFIPVVSRISAKSGLPVSRLLMPMGFTAILGGTMTMIGSSPLILLNDLIILSNQGLPAEHQMHTWSLFSVTPIGIALVITGIIYFVIAGKYVLPKNVVNIKDNTKIINYFQDTYNINYDLFEINVPENSNIIGQKLIGIETKYKIRVVAICDKNKNFLVNKGSISRDTVIEGGMALGILTTKQDIQNFNKEFNLQLSNTINTFSEFLSSNISGMAEILIPPNSNNIGKSCKDIWLRKSYGLSIVALHRGGKTFVEGDGIRDISLQSGDTLVVYTDWDDLENLEKNKDFLIITSDYPHKEANGCPEKLYWALLSFVIALCLILFTDIKLSVALLTGAIGMVLLGVLKIEEAYKAVSWKTVFLLASLIPLGLAVELSGTAKWIAEEAVMVVGGMPIWVIQTAIAILATIFTLVMSNVGATVLLVPLVANIAIEVGANPAIFVLTVALATSNSFLIPTHQVNALIMSPGGYKVSDFIRAGSIMTILFIIVLISMMNLVL